MERLVRKRPARSDHHDHSDPPTIQPQRALPFSCPLCLTAFPTRKLFLEHLRSEPELEHKAFRFGATESPLYPLLQQQGVLACPRGCGALFNGGDQCTSKPLELHIGRARCRDRRPSAALAELNGPYLATKICWSQSSSHRPGYYSKVCPRMRPPAQCSSRILLHQP